MIKVMQLAEEKKRHLYPLAFLDAGDRQGHYIRLRNFSQEPPAEEFICLSHCWGGLQPLTTAKHNIREHLSNIPWSNIPRTF